jgi:diguanylate cyclase (GGDEF)-like protein
MALDLNNIFDEYPSPLYIVRPIVVDGVSDDFEYVFVNNAFSLFIGKSKSELIGHHYKECFDAEGERGWLDTFVDVAVNRKYLVVDNVSTVINKRMYTELFHIEPDMCGCIIRNFETVLDSMESSKNRELMQKANCDCLTGFFNRFYLNELYDDIARKANVGITFLDINNLKVTNDTMGHEAGDRLIIKVSEMLRIHYGDSLIFRMGGDEFLVITEGCTRDGFLRLSAEGRALFGKDNLAATGYQFYETLENLRESIKYCDQLMYEQKRLMKAR